MAATYFLSDGSSKLGPFSESQILESIASGKIGLFDLILNQQTNDWVMILQHPDFADVGSGGNSKEKTRIKSIPDDHRAVGLLQDDFQEKSATVVSVMKEIIKATYDRSRISASHEEIPSVLPTDWYLKDGAQGPFSYLEMVKLISLRKVNEQSSIGQSANGPWKNLSAFEQFSSAALAQFRFANSENLPEVHIRRKSVRKVCGKSYIIFANENAFKVYCVDISDAGCGVLMRTSRLKKDEEVFIKFSESLDSNKFDVKARVVSERRVRLPGDDNMYIRFGLSFEGFSESGRQYVLNFIKTATKDAV